MILVDTSAWIEFLRGTGSDVHHQLRAALQSGAAIATTEVVAMELFAGARSERELTALRGVLGACDFVPADGLADYEEAAAIYRACRVLGITPRQLNDCLIAAVARRNDLELLYADRDFDAIASVVPIRVAR